MTFYGGLVIGIMIGVIIGVIIMALMFVAKGSDKIISDLYQALEEWVDDINRAGMVPRSLERKYKRSCKALNRARRM